MQALWAGARGSLARARSSGARGYRHDSVHQCRHRAPSFDPDRGRAACPAREPLPAADGRLARGSARGGREHIFEARRRFNSTARPLHRWRPRRSPASAPTSARAASTRSPWWACSPPCVTMPSARRRAYSPESARGAAITCSGRYRSARISRARERQHLECLAALARPAHGRVAQGRCGALWVALSGISVAERRHLDGCSHRRALSVLTFASGPTTRCAAQRSCRAGRRRSCSNRRHHHDVGLLQRDFRARASTTPISVAAHQLSHARCLQHRPGAAPWCRR